MDSFSLFENYFISSHRQKDQINALPTYEVFSFE